jgi:hypothetical protein
VKPVSHLKLNTQQGTPNVELIGSLSQRERAGERENAFHNEWRKTKPVSR